MRTLLHRLAALACGVLPLAAQTAVGPGIFDSTRGSINNTQVEYPSPSGEIAVSVPGFNGRMRIQFPRTMPAGTVTPDGQTIRLAEPVTITLGVTGTRVAGSSSSSNEIRVSIQYGQLSGCAPQARNFPVGSAVDLTLTCTVSTINLPVSVTPTFFPALLGASYDIWLETPGGGFIGKVNYTYPSDFISMASPTPSTPGPLEAGTDVTFCATVRANLGSRDSGGYGLRVLAVGGGVVAVSPPVPIQRNAQLAMSTPCTPSTRIPAGVARLAMSAVLLDAAGAVLKESTLIVEYTVTGLSPAPRPRKQTDTRFVTSSGAGIGTPCLRRSGGPLEISIDVTRAVGEVDEEGVLKGFDKLVRSGVVSNRAALRIASAGQRVQPGSGRRLDKVFLNGKELKPITTTADQWSTDYVAEVPLEDMRFPARSLQRPAGTPTPRSNKLRIEIDAAGGGENWCATVAWAELSFSAMAPVVLVHGNGQGDDGKGGEFWEGAVLDTPEKQRESIGTGGFLDAWKILGIPYDNSISMLTDSTAAHGTLLGRLIPDAAAAWGARHVHIVTHSKGGLDSRDFIARTIPPNFGVYSIHTIAGPHQGSAGPDYQIDAQGAWAMYSDDSIRTKIGAEAPPNKGTQSLRVAETARFNLENVPKLPPEQTVDEETHAVQYRSFSADMNLNDDYNPVTGNPVISYDETKGLPGQGDHLDVTWASVIQSCYRITGYVLSTYTSTVTTVNPETRARVVYKIVKENLTSKFRPNDVAVTQESSQVGPFQEIKHMDGNHSTIARPETAELVLESLRKIQPMKDPVE